MNSPFPGMDPYLEWYWGDVHASLAIYARNQLAGQLPPDLRVRVEEYVGIDEETGNRSVFKPDVSVAELPSAVPSDEGGVAVAVASATETATERVVVTLRMREPPTLRYLRIIDVRSGNRLVTAIEFLSLANKKGKGRAAYREKQRDLTEGGANLVEIDLLRAGRYMLLAPEQSVPVEFQGPYRVCIFRASRPDEAELYRVSLRQQLPAIHIPLREKDADVQLDLQQLVEKSYADGRYDDIDYKAEPVPPLDHDDADWAHGLLKEKGLR